MRERKVPEKNKRTIENNSRTLEHIFYIFAEEGPALGPEEMKYVTSKFH